MNNFIQDISDQFSASIEESDLSEFFAIIKDPETQRFLVSKDIQLKDKVKVLKKAEMNVHLISALLTAANFLERYTGDFASFENLLKGSLAEKEGIPLVQIELAKPIAATLEADLEILIRKKLFPHTKKCTFVYSYYEKLLGGMIVRHLDQVWDLSWSHQLVSLQQAILAD